MHLDWWTLALQTVNFAILVWLLHRFLYKPVLRMIDARKAEIERQYSAARAAGEKAQAELAAAAAQRAAVAAEREAGLAAAAAQARKLIAARRSEAERDAQALLDGARKTLTAERARALEEARRMALDLGAAFARQLLAEVPMQLRAEAWLERIEQYIDGLPALERDGLRRQLVDGGILTVVTAAPLAQALADRWRERLRRRLGEAIVVSFEASPLLIAGAELHFPTALLRFSWQSALEAARAELGSHADAR